MLARLPVDINPYRLIEQRRTLTGVMPIAALLRLHDHLIVDESFIEDLHLQVELVFTRNDMNLPVIQGSIAGYLPLSCQRCLSVLDYEFKSDLNIVLIRSDAEADRLEDGFDTWLVEDERIHLQDFIEDEVLLSLPLVSRHNTCEPVKPLIEALPDQYLAEQQEEDAAQPDVDNPFAVLKHLK